MKLVFCAQTALDLCSRLAAEQARIAQPCRMRSLAGCASAACDIDRMNLSPVTDLIGKDFLKPSKHILVSGDSHRFRSREYVRHTWGGAFPNMSFYQIADDVFVTSPELSIVMLAPSLSFNNLVALCCESCGRYVRDPTHPKGIRKRPPLTNIARLSCYVEKLGPHTKGIAKLRQALKYAIDGCRLPMETAIALLISLPVKYGGYGFPKPLVNWRIDLTSEQQRMAQRHYIEADLYFKDANATVEYDSDEEHSQPKSIASDAIRNNTLRHLGIPVLNITWGQVRSTSAFDDAMKQLGALLGKSVLKPSDASLAKRHKLRSDLLPPVTEH